MNVCIRVFILLGTITLYGQVLGQYNADNDAGDDPDSYSALRRNRIDDLAFDINVSTGVDYFVFK